MLFSGASFFAGYRVIEGIHITGLRPNASRSRERFEYIKRMRAFLSRMAAVSMLFSRSHTPKRVLSAFGAVMFLVCVGVCPVLCMAAPPAFPDNLKSFYSADDFRMRSAAATGDIRYIEKQLAGKKGIDGRLALLEFYRRCDLLNDMRRVALELRALLAKEPAKAWNTGKLWITLAKSHEYLGEWNEALRAYRRSLGYDETAANWERIMEMELALRHVEASEEACRSWLAARKANERLRRRELARLYERLGMKNVAAETYARAAEDMPLEPSALFGYLRCETSAARRVNISARILEKDGHKLNTITHTVELLITQGRAPEASQLLDRMASFFTARKSMYWALLKARAFTAAGEWEKAALAFRQARLWRPDAPEEERAYFLTHEADLWARLGRATAVAELLGGLQGPVWEESVFFARLRLLCALETPAEDISNAVAAYASAPDGSWKNMTTDFLSRLSDMLPNTSGCAFIGELWDRLLGTQRDPVVLYEAGRFYARSGKFDKAYALFLEARPGMRGFGKLLPYLAIMAERTGRAKEADEYRAQGCYLLGRTAYLECCAVILTEMESAFEQTTE